MCVSKPSYTAPRRPPEIARSLEPDSGALHDEAVARSQTRGGGATRGTVLTGLRGLTNPAMLGSDWRKGKTVLG